MSGHIDFVHKADQDILKLALAYQKELEKSLPNAFTSSSKELSRRITQVQVKDKYKSLLKKTSDDVPLRFENTLHGRSLNRFRVCSHVFFHQMAYFLTAFTSLFSRFFVKKVQNMRIFIGAGIENYISDNIPEEFANYCKKSSIPVLETNDSDLIVQSQAKKYVYGRGIHFYHRPYFLAAFFSRLSVTQLLQLFVDSIKVSFNFCRLSKDHPELLLLATDLRLFPLIKTLNSLDKIEAIIITNSSFYDQEFWLNQFTGKKLTSILLWYSTNTRSFHYKDSTAFSEHPSNRFISVDESYTWNEDHARWLTENTLVKKVHVVSPIIYQLPSKEVIKKDIDVLIFDVTPVPRSWIDQNISENFYYYFKTPTMKKFVQDILSVGDGIKFAIKSKRQFDDIHDKDYIHFIQEITSSHVLPIDPKENIFNLVRRAHLVIVFPFSSPAYISSHMGVKTAYYDPKAVLNFPNWLDNKIDFIDSKENLKSLILEHLKTKDDK